MKRMTTRKKAERRQLRQRRREVAEEMKARKKKKKGNPLIGLLFVIAMLYITMTYIVPYLRQL